MHVLILISFFPFQVRHLILIMIERKTWYSPLKIISIDNLTNMRVLLILQFRCRTTKLLSQKRRNLAVFCISFLWQKGTRLEKRKYYYLNKKSSSGILHRSNRNQLLWPMSKMSNAPTLPSGFPNSLISYIHIVGSLPGKSSRGCWCVRHDRHWLWLRPNLESLLPSLHFSCQVHVATNKHVRHWKENPSVVDKKDR